MGFFGNILRKNVATYVVVNEYDKFELEEKVNQLIRLGYKPVGGVCQVKMKTGGNQYDYAHIEQWSQAMIKR